MIVYTSTAPTFAPTCHACDDELTEANESPVSDTCDECVRTCLCYVCREKRWEMAGERVAELARMAWGDR